MTVIPPMLVTVRSPNADQAELVVTLPGKPSMVIPISFATARMINRQTAEIIEGWPVREVPAM